jgi:hypothetical protein
MGKATRSRPADGGTLHHTLWLWEYRSPRHATISKRRTVPMVTMASQYEVVELTPNGRPWREHVQHLLNEYACEGWELVTSFQAEGETPQHGDQMIRSFSHVPSSTLFIFKRPAKGGGPGRCGALRWTRQEPSPWHEPDVRLSLK